MGTRTLHMAVAIDFMIDTVRAHPDEEFLVGLKGEAAVKALKEAKAQGLKYIPQCDDTDDEGKCRGHREPA